MHQMETQADLAQRDADALRACSGTIGVEQRSDRRVSAVDALVQAQGAILRPFVFDAETARISAPSEPIQHGMQIDIPHAELAELSMIQALEMHVTDVGVQDLEGGHAGD